MYQNSNTNIRSAVYRGSKQCGHCGVDLVDGNGLRESIDTLSLHHFCTDLSDTIVLTHTQIVAFRGVAVSAYQLPDSPITAFKTFSVCLLTQKDGRKTLPKPDGNAPICGRTAGAYAFFWLTDTLSGA